VAELASVLGTRLRNGRKAAGLTQALLAQRSGVSTELVSRIERGRCLPSVPTLVAFARALGSTPNELLGFQSEDAPEVTALLTLLRGLPASRRREIHRIAEALATYERQR
jgi:transcriptional regulator with XRE-family HTH domain